MYININYTHRERNKNWRGEGDRERRIELELEVGVFNERSGEGGRKEEGFSHEATGSWIPTAVVVCLTALRGQQRAFM